MPHDPESQTGSALLDVLQNPMDNRAWSIFVKRYGPKISAWCRRQGLRQGGVEEVTQKVMVKLVVKLRKFTYEPRKGRFRGWLKKVTDNVLSDYWKDERKNGRVTEPAVLEG